MRRKAEFAVPLITCLALASVVWPTPARAQVRGRVSVVVGGGRYYRPYYRPYFRPYFRPYYGAYYDPFFSPYAFYPQYPYPYPYPYGYRWADPESDVRVQVTPKEAAVYVDGYYAGVVDDFDGFLQRLRVPPGEHEIVLHLDGYRTHRQKLYLPPNKIYKLRYAMEKLGPGETSEPPPVAQAPAGAPSEPWTPPEAGTPPGPRRVPPARRMPPPPQRETAAEASVFGTVAIRVQPVGAEVLIDGEPWQGPEGQERLIVQVSEGLHQVEIRKDGYESYSTEVQVRRGETTPLNVSLPPRRE